MVLSFSSFDDASGRGKVFLAASLDTRSLLITFACRCRRTKKLKALMHGKVRLRRLSVGVNHSETLSDALKILVETKSQTIGFRALTMVEKEVTAAFTSERLTDSNY